MREKSSTPLPRCWHRPSDIEVEGFADELRPVDPYPTNWELSASRATGVLRSMVEDGE